MEGSWDSYRKNLNCRIERKKNRRESEKKRYKNIKKA